MTTECWLLLVSEPWGQLPWLQATQTGAQEVDRLSWMRAGHEWRLVPAQAPHPHPQPLVAMWCTPRTLQLPTFYE